MYKAKQFNKIFPLPWYFAPMIGDKKEIYLADIGSGLFSTTGSTWPTATIHIFPSDMLADEFSEMLKTKNITPLIPVKKENMEELSYPDAYFDIVHCANALDHTTNPLKAIKEMYRVCKPGGWIYLRHYSHVGEHQAYCGLHQWNLDICNKDDCRIWNKTNEFTLSILYAGFKTELKKEMPWEPEDMVVSTLHKV